MNNARFTKIASQLPVFDRKYGKRKGLLLASRRDRSLSRRAGTCSTVRRVEYDLTLSLASHHCVVTRCHCSDQPWPSSQTRPVSASPAPHPPIPPPDITNHANTKPFNLELPPTPIEQLSSPREPDRYFVLPPGPRIFKGPSEQRHLFFFFPEPPVDGNEIVSRCPSKTPRMTPTSPAARPATAAPRGRAVRLAETSGHRLFRR